MARRWVRWTGGGLLVVLLLLGWRVSLEIPERLARLERSLLDAAARSGLRIRYGSLKFHPLHLRVSIDNIAVTDAIAGVPLGTAGSVDVSISPIRFLSGDLPVSRIRVRNFRFEAGEANRELYGKLSSGRGEPSGGELPEILLLEGSVRLGPLGPLRRFDADVREFRIRTARFLGTRVTVTLEHASGEIDLAGAGASAWPYPSMEADLLHKGGVLRVRRLKASGDGSTALLSGSFDTRREILDGKISGEIDLARWVAAGAPGGRQAGSVAREGKVEVSATVSGTLGDPRGTGRILFRSVALPGLPRADAEAELSLEGRVVQLTRLRSKIWGGTLEAAGRYDVAGGTSEGKASLLRVSLAAVPWDAFGAPVRLAGTGDLSVLVEGGPGRLRGSASLSIPDGVERHPGAGEGRHLLRVPLSAEAAGELRDGRELRIDSIRLRAGGAETRGEGSVSLAGRTIRMRGTVTVPAGKAADYGWGYPLSWGKAEGTWVISGPAAGVHVAGELQVDSLAARSLPPFPFRLKAEGQPARDLQFVAEVPGRAFRVTATGTVASPLAPSRTRAEIAVAARDVDLSESARWATAVAASLGKDAGELPRYLSGMEGAAEGDAQVSIAAGSLGISGSARSRRLVVRGVPLPDVKAAGRYSATAGSVRWDARGDGRLGDGSVWIRTQRGGDGDTELSGGCERLEIAHLFSLLRRENPVGVRGALDAQFQLKEGPHGWEVPHAVAEAKELAAGAMKFADVRAGGNLGASEGKFSASSSSPRLTLAGEVRREVGWPVKFGVSAVEVPTSFLLAVAGRGDVPSGGTWNADAGGEVRVGDLLAGKRLPGEVFTALHASFRSSAPSVGDARFEDFRVSGNRQGDSIRGEIEIRLPATRLAWAVNLREPLGFRLEGPFSLGEADGAAPKDETRRFSLQGRAEIEGALRALEKTSGTVQVGSVLYREGGLEMTGKDLSARMDPEGVRWTGGTITAGGNPMKVSGKVSWKGDLDVRLDGKVPAAALRLVVPGLFERLGGVLTVGVRLAGRWDDPTIVGTGHAEGATLSFAGYGQIFEAVRADAVISREKIIFEHFEGKTGGGYFDGRGEVPLNMDAGQRLYFSVDFLDVRYPYPDDFQPVVQGHAELIGPLEDLLVTGQVEVQSARFTRNLYPERALVDFSRRLADVSARREKSDFRVRLDIDVVADRTIRLKNNLVDARASGEFKIAGDSSKVIVLGSFDVYEGYVEYYGSRYDLKRVVVDFQDPRRNNPRLDARAETKKGNYNVTVSVGGTLEKPEVDFASDPPLSRTDIVSLLSFGVTTQALGSTGTGSGGSSGAAGAAAVVVGTYVGGVDEKIRGVVGLDRFSIETGFSQTTQQFVPRFVVGKSFGDRATVSVSTSVGTSAETSASGELKIRENLYLQGAWESNTGSTRGDISGDLKVKYRFRQFKDLLRGGE
jgi:hypothetical protein